MLCSQTSRKRPPKMSSLGGRLQEMAAYESLDDVGPKIFLIRLTPCFKSIIHVESQF